MPGTITALVTPFQKGGVDVKGLQQNIEEQIDAGIEGVLALGTTGESPTLTREERRVVISTTVEAVRGRVPVFVGTGTNATQTTIELTLEAEELGAHTALVVTPYYNNPMQEGIYEHFAAICRATEIPICVYNIPKRTGRNITVATLKKIAVLPQVIGVKESSGDLNQSAAIIREVVSKREDFMVWSGDDALTLPMMSLGAKGIISVASNLIPRDICKMVDAASTSDFETARQHFYRILPLFEALFVETNPIPIKAAMEMCGMAAGSCRLPLGKMSEENRQVLVETLRQCGLS